MSSFAFQPTIDLIGVNPFQGTATFIPSAADAGTVGGVAYSAFENLSGLGEADVFTLDHAVTGTVSGDAGNDAFALANGVTVGSMDGGADSDTLTVAGGTVFVVNAADAGTADGQAFTTMENLTGDGSVDTFTFTAALTGTASGLGGNDTFAINDGGSAGTFDGGADTDSQMPSRRHHPRCPHRPPRLQTCRSPR